MTASSPYPSSRPATVTAAVTIGWVAVIVDVIAGISAFLLAGNAEVIAATGVDPTVVQINAIVTLVMAAVLAYVVSRLGRGGNVARMLVTLVMLVRLGIGAWALLMLGSHHMGESLTMVAMSLLAVGLLWNAKANEFFATNNP